MVINMITELTKENFDGEVNKAEELVLVDFWASWCGPCRMVGPIIDELDNSYGSRVKVGKVNIDEQLELATMHGIVSIPTVMVFKNGKVMERIVGAHSRDDYEDILDKYL